MAHSETTLGDVAAEAAGKVVRKLRDQASDVADKLQDKTSHLAGNIGHAIGEHPTNTVLLSFGVGCLTGFLFGYLLLGRE